MKATGLKQKKLTPASSKQFLDIQKTIECGFTLKFVHDKNILKTYS